MRLHRHTIAEKPHSRRTFVTLYRDDDFEVVSGSFERYWLSSAQHTGLSLCLDDGSPQVFAGLNRVACGWLKVSWFPLSRWFWNRHKITDQDVVEVKVHGGAVWWSLWHPSHEWSSKTPRWRHGNWNVVDALLGKRESITVKDEPVGVTIPMLEGPYQATVTMERVTVRRPRWPGSKTYSRYDLDDIRGPHGKYIPIPGKGENSWDCGGDGLFAQSGEARTVEEAIGNVVAGVLRDRKRRIGTHVYSEPIS